MLSKSKPAKINNSGRRLKSDDVFASGGVLSDKHSRSKSYDHVSLQDGSTISKKNNPLGNKADSPVIVKSTRLTSTESGEKALGAKKGAGKKK